MNRRSLNDLLDGALEPLPRVRIELDPLFFGRCRLRSVSWWTRHSAKYVIGSEQLEAGGSDTPGAPRPVKLCEPTRDGHPYLRASKGTFNGRRLRSGDRCMAEQPSEPVKRTADLEVQKPDSFDQYAAAVGNVAYVWNYLHERLAEIFAAVMNPCPGEMSLAVWYSSRNDHSQRLMLEAALRASPRNRWGANRRTVHADLVWLVKEVTTLWGDRDDAVHAPVSAYVGSEGMEMRAAYEYGHPRASRLRNKNLADEFAYCEARARVLGEFAARVSAALKFQSRAWPNRPPLPDRPRKNSHQAQLRQPQTK
jgi:hypothetical protein